MQSHACILKYMDTRRQSDETIRIAAKTLKDLNAQGMGTRAMAATFQLSREAVKRILKQPDDSTVHTAYYHRPKAQLAKYSPYWGE